MRFIKSLFGKNNKKQSTTADEAEAIVKEIVNLHVETEQMRKDAKTVTGPSIVLTPSIPLPAVDSAGWFGGSPRLPSDLEWPEIDGTPLHFVAQIDLSKLPKTIWSGAGPRIGQLAFFLHPQRNQPKVLHLVGDLEKRSRPSSERCHWTGYDDKINDEHEDVLPEWPVELTTCVGPLPDPVGKWLTGFLGGSNPRTFERETPNLLDPRHQPFDRFTLDALIESAESYTKRQLSAVTTFLDKKKLKASVSADLITLEERLETCQQKLLEAKGYLASLGEKFDLEAITPVLRMFHETPAGRTEYTRNDAEGYAEIEVSWGTLDTHCKGYLKWLERQARYAYTEGGSTLSPEAVERFERDWSVLASHEAGGMSHPPKGHIYTPYGSQSPNEVLLELHSSDLVGWDWADGHSIVFLINRSNLASGNFDTILTDVTN